MSQQKQIFEGFFQIIELEIMSKRKKESVRIFDLILGLKHKSV